MNKVSFQPIHNTNSIGPSNSGVTHLYNRLGSKICTSKCVIRLPLQLDCLTWGDLPDDSLNSCNVHGKVWGTWHYT